MKKITSALFLVIALATAHAQMLPNMGPYPKTTKNAACKPGNDITGFNVVYVTNGAVMSLNGTFFAGKGVVTEVNVQYGRSMRRWVCGLDVAGQTPTYGAPESFLITSSTAQNNGGALKAAGVSYPGASSGSATQFVLKAPGQNLAASANTFVVPMNLPPVAKKGCREEFETFVTLQVKFADGSVVEQLLVAKGVR